jgi:hypothetical protein
MIRQKGSTLDTYIVEKHEINTVWNDVKDLIVRTNDDVLNEEDILEYLKTGNFILWIVTKPDSDAIVAAMTVEYAHYPRHKMCRVVTIAGEMLFEWVDEGLLMLEDWAKAQGCAYMDMYARRGWKKVLKEYKEDCILLRKKL